jgi:asparagine synthase (glutamine-hydrolysing)
MSGISGIISSYESDINIPLLKRMSSTLSHRGVDGGGIWINPKKTLGLSHCRLATIDLSFNAAQPMHYKDRYSIVHDGEIYNYIEIKQDLQKAGYVFRNNSDTEVVLAAYDFYKERCVYHFDGKFAFAIWDEVEQCLFAARDRFGEKPFYYYKDKTRFIFSSEMKAIWSAGIEKSVDFKMLINYLSLGDVQNPSDKSQTFYNKINALPPSHYITVHKNLMEIEPYWNIDKNNQVEISEKAAIEKLEFLLSNAIKKRMRGDVSIGIRFEDEFDTSTILYLTKSISKKSFTFYGTSNSNRLSEEKQKFEKLAKEYDTEQDYLIQNDLEIVSEFKNLFYYQEEPFSFESYLQFNLYKEASKKNTKIIIDNLGIEHLIAGDKKYAKWYLQEIFRKNKFKKYFFEKKKLKENGIDLPWGITDIISTYLPPHIAMSEEKKLYNKIVNHPHLTKHILTVISGREWDGIHKPIVTKLNDVLYFDMMEMGLEEKLRISDRMAMFNGIELRHPFLQYELVNFLFSLPSVMKINNGFSKYILRRMMQNYTSKDIVWAKQPQIKKEKSTLGKNSNLMHDFVFECKKSLVNNQILKPSILDKKHTKTHQSDNDEFDWRYINAAHMLSNI